eukprot:INCI14728.1.p3 GENE.INCI14728.1~~INCI14728.1.p3  ORF type:complete len:271 (+),score=76.58 INCI14728.1:534-1346(+)
MGAAGSVEGGEACSQIVTVEQASEIMSIVFSKQVTHSALREFLATARRDMIDDATVRQIIEVLEKPSAASVQQQQQAQQQQQQQQQPIAAGTLAERVKAAFYGQFDSVKQAFHNADVNGGGSISHEEFAEAVRAGGLEISDEDVAAAAASIDTNHDGSINYTEFLRFLTDSSQPDEYAQNAAYHIAGNLRVQIRERFKSMREAFISLDPDRSGSIDTAEVQKLLRGQNFGYSDEDINLFVASYPHTKDGGFSYVEFCRMVEGQQPFVGME